MTTLENAATPFSFLSEEITLEGTVYSTGPFVFSGNLNGSILHTGNGTTQIAKTARILGNIQAMGHIIIAGRIEGNVQSATSIEVTGSGTVLGTLTAPSIQVENGARIDAVFSPLHPTKIIHQI